MNIHRLDKSNAGDWWSPPGRYFPFRPAPVFDILNSQNIPNEEGLYIVGGGGLGSLFFQRHLNSLNRANRKYKLVAWGVGSDIINNYDAENKLIKMDDSMDLLGNFFDGFDEIGTRVHNTIYQWVPCASCMHPAFYQYRKRKPGHKVGIFFHKRVPIDSITGEGLPKLSNDGDNIEEKLDFMSNFEFIITNSYHGVYWATLLNRKVLCVPFKSGLFSFKHKPTYIYRDPNNEDFESAVSYPDALEECRAANVSYFNYLYQKYGVV